MSITKENNILKTLFFVLLAIFSAYIVSPYYLPAVTYLCEAEKINMINCLDSSWVLSIHWALQKGLVFGRDYIFTYGPLGFLGTRTSLGFNHLYFLISDLFIISNLVFISVYAFRRFYNIQSFILCLLTTYTICGVGMYSDQIGFPLLLISIFWLNHFLEQSKPISLIIPIVITSLLFYIKVNLSFVGLVIFYIYIFYSILTDKSRRPTIILFGLAIPVSIFLLSFPLNTDIPGYVRGALELVDGYNDAMSIKANEYFSYLLAAVFLILTFFSVFFIIGYNNLKFRRNIPLFLTLGVYVFTLYKQSFVRSDLHIIIFFTFFPGICGLAMIFYEKLSIAKVCIFLGICLVCLMIGLQLNAYPKLSDRINYYNAIIYPNNLPERYANAFNRFTLPSEVKNIIGDKTVDIIPWNINYLYYNRLNYNPRPVIQSYTAYTPYLINLNQQKYESETAPEFVIFSNFSIDGRYAFFDDQAVKISLINNYTCLGLYNTQGSDFLLFQKKLNSINIPLSDPIEKSIKFNEDYFLEDVNKSYFIKIQVNSSVFGKAIRFAYKPFQLSIIFTLMDGTTRQYRVIAPILKNGVVINPLIEDEKDYYNLINGLTPPDSKRIKSFKIILDSPRESIAKIAAKTYDAEIQLAVSEVSLSKK